MQIQDDLTQLLSTGDFYLSSYPNGPQTLSITHVNRNYSVFESEQIHSGHNEEINSVSL